MADPFSVAGSAVGVVSLGLAVCQGLVTYYTAYKGQDDEVDRMVERTSCLTDLLERLQPCLEDHRAPHTVAVDGVERCVIACYGSIKKLEKVLLQCKKATASDGFRERVRTMGRKALFPFRRETLHELKQAVSECQDNLNTAISFLSIELHASHSRHLTSLETSVQIVSGTTAVTFERVEDIHRVVLPRFPAFAQMATTPQLLNNAPSVLGTLTLPNADMPETQSTERHSVSVAKDLDSLCGCRPRKHLAKSQYQLGPVVLLSTTEVTSPHRENCPYYFPRRNSQRQFGCTFRIGTASRKWDVKAALNYNFSIGAFSVGPCVAFKATVPRDHPPFALLYDLKYPKYNSTEKVLNATESLQRMFNSGVASPTDVDPSGATLLHAAAHFVSTLSCIWGDTEFTSACRRLLRALLQFDIALNECDNLGMHVVDIIVDDMLGEDRATTVTLFLDMHRDIVNRRDYFYDEMESLKDRTGVYHHSSPCVAMKLNDDFLQAFECNYVGKAILRRSVDVMDIVKAATPAELRHRDFFGHTVLHLAADFPEGLRALLQCPETLELVNIRDYGKKLPLHRASSEECVEAASLLLEADSSIDWSTIELHSNCENPSLSRVLFHHLADRRRRLAILARSRLPRGKLKRLQIPTENPMDGPQADDVVKELQLALVDVPEHLICWNNNPHETNRQTSVFFDLKALAKSMELIWESGFRPDFARGSLVQMVARYNIWETLDVMLWAKSKGIFISTEHFHDIMSVVRYWRETPLLHPMSKLLSLLGDVFTTTTGPMHNCACCKDGCIPALAIPGGRFQLLDKLLVMAALKLAENNIDLAPHFWTWLAPRMIRRHLFSQLGLTHSIDCCRSRRYEQDEVNERQREEWYLRSRLDSLVEELTADYESRNMRLSEFLKKYVKRRAKKVLRGEQEPSSQDRQRAREIGVLLDENQDEWNEGSATFDEGSDEEAKEDSWEVGVWWEPETWEDEDEEAGEAAGEGTTKEADENEEAD
ncbi:hypothetical protein B0J12DRAFT_699061 [Macrophomina phaseolina]|uniref:Fungal N-terminal domain-containing protein n=1 Tax=Macrophomina phaseolina TaxID=35725 RepID=A0ABQ8GDI8_9PEZI|nr:hypothetical protein B0J12DRAFT_699061 [Macrophomina phaseolina]